MSNSLETQLQALEQTKISAVLESIRGSNNFKISDWTYQPLTKGSITGNVFRLSGTGTDNGTMTHWSLILKFVRSPASTQAGVIHQLRDEPSRWDYWKRELYFYQSPLPDSLPIGLTAPRCYHIEEQFDGYWLWLEDIADVYKQRWPIARFGLAARHLARFSGAYLVDADIPAYSWLTRDKDFIRDWEGRVANSDALAKIEQLRHEHHFLRRGWPDEVLVGFSRVWQEREQYFEVIERLPKTLQHADSSHKNLLARRGQGEKEETVALDWALVGIGTIGEELASLVFGTLMHAGVPMTQASELETVVLDGYVQGLQDAGWKGDPSLVKLGYLTTLVLGFGFFVTFTPEFLVLADEDNAKRIEAIYEQPLNVVIDNRVQLRHFILDRAHEARSLMIAL